MALSLVVIALSFVVIALVLALTAREATGQLRHVGQLIEKLRGDLAPALEAMRGVAEDGRRFTSVITEEASELAAASRRFREAMHDRLANLDAIYEVLEEEVEETALDVATTLRTMRSRAGWFGRLRRLLALGSGR